VYVACKQALKNGR